MNIKWKDYFKQKKKNQKETTAKLGIYPIYLKILFEVHTFPVSVGFVSITIVLDFSCHAILHIWSIVGFVGPVNKP